MYHLVEFVVVFPFLLLILVNAPLFLPHFLLHRDVLSSEYSSFHSHWISHSDVPPMRIVRLHERNAAMMDVGLRAKVISLSYILLNLFFSRLCHFQSNLRRRWTFLHFHNDFLIDNIISLSKDLNRQEWRSLSEDGWRWLLYWTTWVSWSTPQYSQSLISLQCIFVFLWFWLSGSSKVLFRLFFLFSILSLPFYSNCMHSSQGCLREKCTEGKCQVLSQYVSSYLWQCIISDGNFAMHNFRR